MALSEKQMELDKIKWEISEKNQKDACGSFDYCANCDKTVENPCEVALNKTEAEKAEKTTKKVAKKTTTATKKTSTTKTTTAKKTTKTKKASK